MTSKAVANTYKFWLCARQEKVIFSPKYGHERVAQSVNRKDWKTLDIREMIELMGKDAMLQELGMKDHTENFKILGI